MTLAGGVASAAAGFHDPQYNAGSRGAEESIGENVLADGKGAGQDADDAVTSPGESLHQQHPRC